MKTKYQYIHFKVIRECAKTKVWGIYNNKSGTQLGGVAWYPPWRQHCFYAVDSNSVFNDSCLKDIINFIRQLKSNG